MNNRRILSIGAIAIILIALWVVFRSQPAAEVTDIETIPEVRVMSIEDYIKLNISDLSPEKEVLGGKFYVTNVETDDGAGTVYYEDGHNAFIADFTYEMNNAGAITITSFKVRE